MVYRIIDSARISSPTIAAPRVGLVVVNASGSHHDRCIAGRSHSVQSGCRSSNDASPKRSTLCNLAIVCFAR